MKVSNTVSGAFFIGLAGLIFFLTRHFRHMPGQSYGADFFPRTIAVAMAAMGLVLVIQGLRARERAVTWPDWIRSPRHRISFLIVVVALVFYILTSDTLGFLISGFLTLGALLLWLRGPQHWASTLGISVAAVLLLQYFFGQLLRVPLPWGLLQDYAW